MNPARMFSSLFEISVAVLLLAWFVVSVLNQFNLKRMDVLRAHDRLGLLAQWRFFGRNSGQWDYHVFYREKYPGGHLSDWHAIPVREVRAAYHCLWNPQKRTMKVLTDLSSIVAGASLRTPDLALKSVPYLLLVHAVIHHKVIDAKAERQFLILRTLGGAATQMPEVLFRSVFHKTKSEVAPWATSSTFTGQL
jgi:hypothetical protein